MSEESPEPGWYVDPEQPYRYRWWDGRAWSDHTSGVADSPYSPMDAEDVGSGSSKPDITGQRSRSDVPVDGGMRRDGPDTGRSRWFVPVVAGASATAVLVVGAFFLWNPLTVDENGDPPAAFQEEAVEDVVETDTPVEEDSDEVSSAPRPSPAPETGREPGVVTPVRVTYEASMPGEPDEILVVSWQPPSAAVLFDGGRMIYTPSEGSLVCSVGAGCEQDGQIGDAGELVATFVPFFNAAATATTDIPDVRSIPNRTIAGQNAECYEITPPPDAPETGTAELCADVETGATLLYSFVDEFGAEQSVRAVAVSDPRSEDFRRAG